MEKKIPNKYQCSTCGKSMSDLAASSNAFLLVLGKAIGDGFQHFVDTEASTIAKEPMFFCKSCQEKGKKNMLAQAIEALQSKLDVTN